ncbi:polysaccharide pyruvyl transferase family protein [Pseudoflavonifractor sp. An187]|uniref:polysaccharide pyruvyl transferase family protein n=1 Tax=Pseudoflavonifractor sp. An187 TaxID=1965578 RepID=UPI000B3AE90F|nr:polysaccharide pyruvyl transferase family protein [Pseudoflavonifractor sp. An187]OUP46153.1 hypothetical protein B5F22_02675 [Pseudoflavonifractor sp. An187]
MILRLKLLATYLFSKRGDIPQLENPNRKIVIALAANYGNLGDVAITYAQKEFLKKNFPEYEVVEFEITNTFRGMKSLKQYIRDEDIITVVGGGNFGDLYDDIEFSRQFIIHNFPKNRIITFPQTISFSKTLLGRLRLLWARFIYNRHKNLTIFVREEFSYKEYCSVFKNLKKAPDIVMSMDYAEPSGLERQGITVCFRNDKENGVDMHMKEKLVSEIKRDYKVQIRDTHVGNQNDLQKLYAELHCLIKVFQSSQVVITDRLHGMILSYITHTPCVVFGGGNKKISGCYKWISKTNYVHLIEADISQENLNEILRCVRELSSMKCDDKEYISLSDKFDVIHQVILEDK